MRTITLEEHLVSQSFLARAGYDLGGQRRLDLSGEQVTDLGEIRLKHMDEAEIDLQVISHVWPTSELSSADEQIDGNCRRQRPARGSGHRTS